MTFSKGLRFFYDGEGGGAGGSDGGSGGSGSSGNTLLGGDSGASGSGDKGGASGAGGASDFKLPDNWDYRTALPAELKESPSAKKYGSLADLVRGFDNAQQLIGKPTERLVEIPTNPDATVTRSVLERLGLPKDEANYKIEPIKVKGAEKFFPPDSAGMKTLQVAAHKLGILPGQLHGLVSRFAEMTVENATAMQTAENARIAESVDALKTELGEAFDGTVAKANFAINKLGEDKAGADKIRDALNDKGLGTDGTIIKMLAKIGDLFAESTSGGDKPDFGGGMTPDNAKAEGMRLLQEALTEKDQMRRRQLNDEAQKYFARAEKRKA